MNSRIKRMLQILVKVTLNNSQSLTLHLKAIQAQSERMEVLHETTELLEEQIVDLQNRLDELTDPAMQNIADTAWGESFNY